MDNAELMIEKFNSLKCDKWDYMFASCCGALAGIIDVIFVGISGNSKLGVASDKLADNYVMKTAQFFWQKDERTKGKSKKMPESLEQCISYLEQAFPVNYDARYAKDLAVEDGMLNGMNPKNHHLLSLSHSPDIIGLVFSIIDQYNPEGSASFIDDGRIIHVIPNKKKNGSIPYLQGKDYKSKLFCGFINWIGHLLSDIVGSSSTRKEGKTGRGMGVPMPFYSMLLMCKLGEGDGNEFANTMIKVYEEGYDLRFGAATAVPVVMEELMIRSLWIIRQKFVRGNSWKESMPTNKNDEFRVMLLIGNFSLCLVDGTEAAIHGVKDQSWVTFVCHLNMAGWTRFAVLIFKEAIIRMTGKIKESDESITDKIFGKFSEEERIRLEILKSKIQEYVSYLDYKAALKASLDDMKLAKEERIKIEEQVRENISKIQQCRESMRVQVEDYLTEYLIAFQEGFELMDSAIAENDVDKYIAGNNIIQSKLDKESQFSNLDEFDLLMDSNIKLKL